MEAPRKQNSSPFDKHMHENEIFVKSRKTKMNRKRRWECMCDNKKCVIIVVRLDS